MLCDLVFFRVVFAVDQRADLAVVETPPAVVNILGFGLVEPAGCESLVLLEVGCVVRSVERLCLDIVVDSLFRGGVFHGTWGVMTPPHLFRLAFLDLLGGPIMEKLGVCRPIEWFHLFELGTGYLLVCDLGVDRRNGATFEPLFLGVYLIKRGGLRVFRL